MILRAIWKTEYAWVKFSKTNKSVGQILLVVLKKIPTRAELKVASMYNLGTCRCYSKHTGGSKRWILIYCICESKGGVVISHLQLNGLQPRDEMVNHTTGCQLDQNNNNNNNNNNNTKPSSNNKKKNLNLNLTGDMSNLAIFSFPAFWTNTSVVFVVPNTRGAVLAWPAVTLVKIWREKREGIKRKELKEIKCDNVSSVSTTLKQCVRIYLK